MPSSLPMSTCGVLVLVLLALSSMTVVVATRLPDLYWNSSNPQFAVKDKPGSDSLKLDVRLMDKMNFVCPHFNPSEQSPGSDGEFETLKIYQVSDMAFLACQLEEGSSKLFAVCDRPLEQERRISLVFRPYSPMPMAFEYVPGRSYFWISTSDGSLSGINNTRGGLCSSKQMRLRIDIADDGGESWRLQHGTGGQTDENNAATDDETGEKTFKLPDEEPDSRVNPKFFRPALPSPPIETTTAALDLLDDLLKSLSTSTDSPSTSTAGRGADRIVVDHIEMFAEQNGFDLERVEYVRQRAISGMEGSNHRATSDENARSAMELNSISRSQPEDLAVQSTTTSNAKLADVDHHEYVRNLEDEDQSMPDISYQVDELPHSYPVVGGSNLRWSHGDILLVTAVTLLVWIIR